MTKLYLDFETYSEVDIRKHGGMQYAMHPSTQVICLGYAFNDEPAELWTPATEFPQEIIEFISGDGLLYAHNATFEYRLWNLILKRDFEGIPGLSKQQLVDTAALCNTYTLPAALKYAGRALGISLEKLETGVRLINKCCKPNKKGEQPTIWENKKDFEELFLYCKRDVEAMREIVNTLPRDALLPIEQKIWEMTLSMNTRGLPIDIEAVTAISAYITEYVKIKMADVPKITLGCVNTVNQIQKIKDWCYDQGLELDNLQAGTITEVLKQDDVPDNVKDLLKLRQELGLTSTAKFKKIINLVSEDNIVHDNLHYHGTSTGRWAGRGFQMHNLPRASVSDPERYIHMFKDVACGAKIVIDDPVNIGKALIRPMICAPEGWKIMVSDYSSIENRVLAWLADDEETLQKFRDGRDQYVDMASTLYQVAVDQVTKAQRQMGKVIILGCGYQMGWERFVGVCEDWGIEMTKPEAQHIIQIYREKYHKIVRMWHKLNQAIIQAILTGEKRTFGRLTIGTAKVNNVRWLAMQMPSGKSIYYNTPTVEPKYIPSYEHMGKVPTVCHWGVNPYTKKWSQLKVSPGRGTENAVQGTAEQVMAHGMLNVHHKMSDVKLILTVHDEAGVLIPDALATEDKLQEFNEHLCDVAWADGLPLAAEGYIGKRYKKG
jgi:DNA polymerase